MANDTIVGTCMGCGIAVTEDTLGEKFPKVLCVNCVRARTEAQARQVRDAELQKSANRNQMRTRRIWSFIVAGILAAACMGYGIYDAVTAPVFDWGTLGIAIGGAYIVFSFVASLFYDGFIRNAVLFMFGRTLMFPNLITTFDIDGLLWLIGMKILFWIIGIIFGIVCSILGILFGMVCAPFVYPFTLIWDIRQTVIGAEYED